MVFWYICKTRIESETVVDIARVHLSQQVFLSPYFGDICYSNIDIIDNSEYWGTDDTYVKVNSDATSFTTGVCWTFKMSL